MRKLFVSNFNRPNNQRRIKMWEGTITNQQDRALDFIARFPGRDDDEIASTLKIFPRQTVNQICRRLCQKNLVRRKRGKHGKLVNFAIAERDRPAVISPSLPRTSADTRAMTEDEVSISCSPDLARDTPADQAKADLLTKKATPLQMSRQQMHGPYKFLKKLGFCVDKKLLQMDRLLLKSLSGESRARLEYIWAMRDAGMATGLEQYLIPENRSQAALLFSYDWPRMVASFEWLDQIVSKTGCSSIVEMGCGPGFLLKFLSDRYPGVKIQGIDTAENLIRIGSDLCEATFIVGDYLCAEPDNAYELVICNFGFDLPKFTPSRTPHSSSTCGEASYCLGCSDDFKGQIADYMKAWHRWAMRDAPLAITGRITDFGMLRAFVLAAHQIGWNLCLEASSVLTVRSLDSSIEHFPALLFVANKNQTSDLMLEEVARFYVAALENGRVSGHANARQ
jgi:hypothetical protein